LNTKTNITSFLSLQRLQNDIKNWLAEDIGDGDHTTLATINASNKGGAKLIVKENGTIAGIELAKIIFRMVDKNIHFKPILSDGEKVKIGDIAFTVEGNEQTILTAERLVLNCMQRMSGIATKTSYLKSLLKNTNTEVLDTRKTTPGFRAIEKWAVKIGGGKNHRIGLYDMILIKDNHVDYCGGIAKAINATHKYLKRKKKKLQIAIEVRNFSELNEVLKTGNVNRILLDNFSFAALTKAVRMINGKFKTEASGGITEKNIVRYAKTGVDYVSIGALTHHVKSLDMSLKAF
jgi:nicotinate-nucleotide pyrophosphorylase (carboxylating)